jgi:hypothetical protein
MSRSCIDAPTYLCSEPFICEQAASSACSSRFVPLHELATYFRERLFLGCMKFLKVQSPIAIPAASPSSLADLK